MLGAAFACGPDGATPLPEPPSLVPSGIAMPPVMSLAGGALTLEGAPGTATPGAVIEVTDLDGTSPVVATSVKQDGSFSLTFSGKTGDEVRLVAAQHGLHSPPVDMLVTQSELTPSPRHECVTVKPLELRFTAAGSQSFTFENHCSGGVELANLRARLGSPDFSFDKPGAATLEPGHSTTLAVAYAPRIVPPIEDVLFVDVSAAGQTLRYPLGLFAP
jgi:hypothetical protein